MACVRALVSTELYTAPAAAAGTDFFSLEENVMKTTEKARKKQTGMEDEQPEVPEDFICIDPEQKPVVLDFLKGSEQDLKEAALLHLRLCLHCREMAETVLKIKRLESESGYCLHGEKSEIALEAD